jgi:hypothetical protein
MTPAAFKQLQSPFADSLASLLGYQAQTTTSYPAAAQPGAVSRGGSSQATGGAAFKPTGVGLNGATSSNGMQQGPDGKWYLQKPNGSTNMPVVAAPTPVTTTTYQPVGNVNDPLRGIPGYEGPLTAPLGANEQALLDKLMQQQSGPGGYDPNSPAQGYLMKLLKADPNSINPFLQAAIEAAQRPTFQALEETLSRTLPGRFTQAGQFINPKGSSAFDVAAQQAARDSEQTAADIGTKLSYEAYNSDQGRRLEAAQSLPGISKQEIDTTISNLQAQALPRLIQEMGIERGLQEFQNRMANLLSVLGIAGGATQPTISNNQKSNSSSFGLQLK